ncbi:dynamin family protein [Nocardioides bizhenqiangii]|uniref:Dynamin family protein n=1 Tax=Nocardioides bizhenqiangii TaxID=3095076 RepID=A0ABZ0ZWS7_9ACTN|nr:dynamin family protein [Nocardioides sp. HM61]WQQ27758.1 dynamin family protein [Nocardioides sp. HM61]
MTASHRGQSDEIAGSQMLTEMVRLRGALQTAALPLDLPGVAALREHRQEVIDQLEDYVIPRLMSMDAPLLAVVGGSTGAGKSTLVNTLVGHRVTTPGVLRPTTRSPVLVHHPDEGQWFGQDRMLPDLKRVSHPTNDHDCIQLVPTDSVPKGVAILDAPDVDSVEERNRILAGQLLSAADLWLFVTSAARYSDQVPWEYLKQAAERSTAVAIVLDRTPPDVVETVSGHLARMMAARGLKDSPLFGVAEGPVTDDGLLPLAHVAEIRGWLEALAADTVARSAIVQQTVGGSIRILTRRVYPIADAAEEQLIAIGDLATLVERQYEIVSKQQLTTTSDGTLLRGDLLTRWQEFVGSGELIRSLEAKVGFVRERLVNAIKGKPQQAERVAVAIETGLETLVVEHGEQAAARAAAAWRATPYGAQLVEVATEDLSRATRDLRRRADAEIQAWQAELQELVRSESGEARTSTRFLAVGVRGLAVTLAVVVLGGEQPPAAAADSLRLGARLLETVVGPGTAGMLRHRARESLEDRIRALLAGERNRYVAPADQWQLAPDAGEQLRAAARRVDDLRYAATMQKGTGGHL